jgi:hypothetical protein
VLYRQLQWDSNVCMTALAICKMGHWSVCNMCSLECFISHFVVDVHCVVWWEIGNCGQEQLAT